VDLERGCLEEGEEVVSSGPQLDLLDDLHGPQVRIKIDNHIDNALQSGENRDSLSNDDRSTAPNSQATTPSRPDQGGEKREHDVRADDGWRGGAEESAVNMPCEASRVRPIELCCISMRGTQAPGHLRQGRIQSVGMSN
jgi:hypothetical protein